MEKSKQIRKHKCTFTILTSGNQEFRSSSSNDYPSTGNFCRRFFFFLVRRLVCLCSYSFWCGSVFFKKKQLNGCSFWPGRNYYFLFVQFCARGLSRPHFVTGKGTFNHCGRSRAWNSTHHGRYVFLTAFFAIKWAKKSDNATCICMCTRVACTCVCFLRDLESECDTHVSTQKISFYLFSFSVSLFLCVSVSVFLVVFGAGAMKVNAWTCAPATAVMLRMLEKKEHNCWTRSLLNSVKYDCSVISFIGRLTFFF